VSTSLSYDNGNEEYQIMMTVTTNNVDTIKTAIRYLMPGHTLLYQDIAWAEYKQIAEENERPGVRITYDRGSLEIMSPLAKHEAYKDFILRLLDRLSIMTEVEFQSLGSTTFDQEWLEKGLEPDNCFYVANADTIIGKRKIDLRSDPPPDVAVEIDITSPSIRKLSIYQEMRVPEVWVYNEQQLRIFLLGVSGYQEFPASQSFPPLTSNVLTQFLEQSKTKSQHVVLRKFQDWLKEQLTTES
jgi:Uma2 family endonuclease